MRTPFFLDLIAALEFLYADWFYTLMPESDNKGKVFYG